MILRRISIKSVSSLETKKLISIIINDLDLFECGTYSLNN